MKARWSIKDYLEYWKYSLKESKRKIELFIIIILMLVLDCISDCSIRAYNYLAKKYQEKTLLIKF